MSIETSKEVAITIFKLLEALSNAPECYFVEAFDAASEQTNVEPEELDDLLCQWQQSVIDEYDL